jgi:26S proteasome regulatory subunit N1
MTSVPKPLKFLRKEYDPLKLAYDKIGDTKTKEICADIISVLAMTISDKRECLKYRFLSTQESVESWGHEYARHLTAELAQEWSEINSLENKTIIEAVEDASKTTTETTVPTTATTTTVDVDVELAPEPIITITKEMLLNLAKHIVQFYMVHNAEADACDLLMEIENVELLFDYVDKDTYNRVCLYLLRFNFNFNLIFSSF